MERTVADEVRAAFAQRDAVRAMTSAIEFRCLMLSTS
jgi:hypothetical protein